MATYGSTSRAIYAGLSCGFAFAAPVAAYVVTMPFPDANGVVASCALPFAAGALAGVGIYSTVSAVGEHRGEGERFGGAAATPAARAARAAHEPEPAEHPAGLRFGGGRMPKDVPVIARAQDALTEEEAWADIDALLEGDLPFSCDAATSKDVYQIALEELRRGASAPVPAGATGSAVSSAPVGAPAATPAPVVGPAGGTSSTGVAGATGALSDGPVPADSTAMFIAMAHMANAMAAGASAAEAAESVAKSMVAHASEASPAQQRGSAASAGAAVSASPGSTVAMGALHDEEPTARVGVEEDLDTMESRRAALASLDAPAMVPPSLEIPTPYAPAPEPLPVLSAQPGMPERPAASAIPARAQAPAPAAPEPAKPRAVSPEPASYAGHEDMWASALDILNEDASAAAAPGRHARLGEDPEGAARAAAIAEGRRATDFHAHVNDLIEEEMDQVSSACVRHTSHEYLKVIQGGTMSMPRVQAKA